jgi:predicted component of type VI protein secretion system
MNWFLRIFRTKVQQTEKEDTQVFSLGRPILNEAESLLRIKAELVIKTGESQGMKLRLGKAIANLGRRETNEVFLDDPNISRVHAQIELLQDEYILTDLGSLNGTYLNGKRIRRARLNSGDQIKLGKTELDFQII